MGIWKYYVNRKNTKGWRKFNDNLLCWAWAVLMVALVLILVSARLYFAYMG